MSSLRVRLNLALHAAGWTTNRVRGRLPLRPSSASSLPPRTAPFDIIGLLTTRGGKASACQRSFGGRWRRLRAAPKKSQLPSGPSKKCRSLENEAHSDADFRNETLMLQHVSSSTTKYLLVDHSDFANLKCQDLIVPV